MIYFPFVMFRKPKEQNSILHSCQSQQHPIIGITSFCMWKRANSAFLHMCVCLYRKVRACLWMHMGKSPSVFLCVCKHVCECVYVSVQVCVRCAAGSTRWCLFHRKHNETNWKFLKQWHLLLKCTFNMKKVTSSQYKTMCKWTHCQKFTRQFSSVSQL